MRNTLENKIKFFTQYWNQPVLLNKNWNEDDGVFGVHAKSMLFVEEDNGEGYYLKLRNLKSINRSEAIQCWNNDNYLANDADVPHVNNLFTDMSGINSDYLRSRGFAIDWLGLKVDTLVEYGWIKIDK